ncbi:unnamed protein product [Zymoseptoria tritici ST99CH_3D1]|nr:unnamed protein product [Zymoseptoria tritici ST99CH_3D1]
MSISPESQRLITYEDALTWLGHGVARNTLDEMLLAVALTVKIDNPNASGLVKKAISIIAKERKSYELTSWLLGEDTDGKRIGGEAALHRLSPSLAQFLTTSALSDFTISCGPRTFKVHKIILAAQSEYFKAAICGRFKESTDGVIDLKARDYTDLDRSCDDPETVAIMVDFCYKQQYRIDDTSARKRGPDGVLVPETKANGKMNKGHMVEHAQVFAVACKYGIPSLRSAASKRFQTAVASHWSGTKFAQTIEEVYGSTPDEERELRKVITKTLLDHPELLHKKDVEATIRGIDGLAYDLLKANTKSSAEESLQIWEFPHDSSDSSDSDSSVDDPLQEPSSDEEDDNDDDDDDSSESESESDEE